MIAYVKKEEIPYITKDQYLELIKITLEELGLPFNIITENAAIGLVSLLRHLTNNNLLNSEIIMLSGKGDKAAIALAAARHLHNFGCKIRVVSLYESNELKHGTSVFLNALQKSGTEIYDLQNINLDKLLNYIYSAEIIVDGIMGQSIKEAPIEPIKDVIEFINGSKRPTLAIDIPSGIDMHKAKIHNPSIRAKYTLSLGLPRKNIEISSISPYAGEIYVCDLSIPRNIYKLAGINLPILFDKSDLIKLV